MLQSLQHTLNRNLFAMIPLLLTGSLTGCLEEGGSSGLPDSPSLSVSSVRETEEEHELVFNGEPFFIQGATSFHDFESLKEYGGNCVRIWDTDSTRKTLDKAHEAGLAVVLVLNMLSERQGMDYDRRDWVLAQRDSLRKSVQAFKDHPALLMWSLGNELDLDYKNMKVWRELDTLSVMVNETDGEHLVTTCVMPRRETIAYIKEFAPGIQILGINSFGYAPDVENLMRGMGGWEKPYFFSEWGPRGYWEVYQTDWEAAYEPSSEEKIRFMNDVYLNHILPNQDLCVGSFVFFWGHKQERTHTWFSLFDESGNPSDVATNIHHLWTGEGSRNPLFHFEHVSLNGIADDQSIYLRPGQQTTASTVVETFDGRPYTIQWEVRKEGNYRGINGGDAEPDTSPLSGLLNQKSGDEVVLSAPQEEGAYRLYLTVRDSSGTFGTANRCFFVMKN